LIFDFIAARKKICVRCVPVAARNGCMGELNRLSIMWMSSMRGTAGIAQGDAIKMQIAF
jgi:hypothetical protein